MMNAKRIWLVIPAALIPYLCLFTMATMFFCFDYQFFRIIMEKVFNYNGPLLVLTLFIIVAVSCVLSIISFVLSICKKWDPVSLAKTSAIIKLLQIPAYLLIFVLGVLLLISIFTFAVSFILCFLDCLTLVLTSLITVAAIVNARRQRLITKTEAVIFSILQFIFVVDVIFSILFLFKIFKREKNGFRCEEDSDTTVLDSANPDEA